MGVRRDLGYCIVDPLHRVDQVAVEAAAVVAVAAAVALAAAQATLVATAAALSWEGV